MAVEGPDKAFWLGWQREDVGIILLKVQSPPPVMILTCSQCEK